MKDLMDNLIGLFWIAVCLALPAAWITHIVVCIDTERWGFLIAGALASPVAIIHGFMIWFGG